MLMAVGSAVLKLIMIKQINVSADCSYFYQQIRSFLYLQKSAFECIREYKRFFTLFKSDKDTIF